MDPVGAIKSAYDLLKDFCEGRETRKKLRVLRAIREAQRGHPAALIFSEENLVGLTGVASDKLMGLLYELEREGAVVRVADGYVLKERWGLAGPYRLF